MSEHTLSSGAEQPTFEGRATPNETPGWTPGPWEVGMEHGANGRVWLIGHLPKSGWFYDTGIRHEVARMFPDSENTVPSNLQKEANARLIAAAPDLYAALEQCARWMESYSPALASDSLASAHAALGRARGQRPATASEKAGEL